MLRSLKRGLADLPVGSGTACHDVVAWQEVCDVPSYADLPPGVLQLVCEKLKTRDLVTLRRVSKAWRDAATPQVGTIDVPMKAYAQQLPALCKAYKQFSGLHTIILSTLACAPGVRGAGHTSSSHSHSQAARHSPLTLQLISNHLSALRGLRRLVLQDVPVLPLSDAQQYSGSTPGKMRCDWDLGALASLRGVTSLDVRLRSCMRGRARRPDVVRAQAAVLQGLSRLTQLRHLGLRLLEVEGLPAGGVAAAGEEGAHQALLGAAGGGGVHDAGHGQGGDANDGAVGGGAAQGAAGAGAAGGGEEGGAAFELEGWGEGEEAGVIDWGDVDFEEAWGGGGGGDVPDVDRVIAPLLAVGRLGILDVGGASLRHGALRVLLEAAAAGATKSGGGLTSLTLNGRVGLCARCCDAVAQISGLHELGLSCVQLIYDQDDPEDCPESLMGRLYGALEALPSAVRLRFELADLDATRFMHCAYLLPLYEADLLSQRLRSLELGTVIFDSDYSLRIFAALTALTSLAVTYQTWPLSLAPEDLRLLAPLSNLRSLKLTAGGGGEHALLALTPGVVAELAASLTRLTCLAFSGLVLLEDGDTALPALASWLSLKDLSLSHLPDPTASSCTLSHHTSFDLLHPALPAASAAAAACTHDEGSPAPCPGKVGAAATNGHNSSEHAPDSPALNGHQPQHGSSAVGGHAAHGVHRAHTISAETRALHMSTVASLGMLRALLPQRLVLDLARSLPPRLEKLALSGIEVGATGGLHLTTALTALTSLQLADCGVLGRAGTTAHGVLGGAEHALLPLLLLSEASQPPALELLVVHDAAEAACTAQRRLVRAQAARWAAAAERDLLQQRQQQPQGSWGNGQPVGAPLENGTAHCAMGQPCSCKQGAVASSVEAVVPGDCQYAAWVHVRSAQRLLAARPPWTPWEDGAGHNSSDASQQETCPAIKSAGPPCPPAAGARSLIGAADAPADAAPVASAAADWRTSEAAAVTRCAVSSACARLRKLSYVMLGLPSDVSLKCDEVLAPLRSLSHLKGLTLQARGCDWSEGEVAAACAGLTSLRALHVVVGAAVPGSQPHVRSRAGASTSSPAGATTPSSSQPVPATGGAGASDAASAGQDVNGSREANGQDGGGGEGQQECPPVALSYLQAAAVQHGFARRAVVLGLKLLAPLPYVYS